MTTLNNVETKSWWMYLDEDLRELLTESLILLTRVKGWENKFHDYAFVVFPAAKAYEGFLKNLLRDMGFISGDDYYGKRFRLGKALNPSLDQRHRDDSWVYDDLANYCNGRALPDKLWDTWKSSRNLLFHWFPNERNAISLEEAEERINKIIHAIDDSFSSCSVELNRNRHNADKSK